MFCKLLHLISKNYDFWCFGKNLEKARRKNPQNLPKMGMYEQLLGIYSTFPSILPEF